MQSKFQLKSFSHLPHCLYSWYLFENHFQAVERHTAIKISQDTHIHTCTQIKATGTNLPSKKQLKILTEWHFENKSVEIFPRWTILLSCKTEADWKEHEMTFATYFTSVKWCFSKWNRILIWLDFAPTFFVHFWLIYSFF